MSEIKTGTRKFTADEILKAWLAKIRQDKTSQYLYRDRKEHLEHLMVMLTAQEVEMDDVIALKRHVVAGLVHAEGMKGQGRYKGWKENAETDFDDAVQIAYNSELINMTTSSKPDYKQDPEIVSWVTKKFGNNIPPSVLKDCHTIGHSLYFLYFEDVRKEQSC